MSSSPEASIILDHHKKSFFEGKRDEYAKRVDKVNALRESVRHDVLGNIDKILQDAGEGDVREVTYRFLKKTLPAETFEHNAEYIDELLEDPQWRTNAIAAFLDVNNQLLDEKSRSAKYKHFIVSKLLLEGRAELIQTMDAIRAIEGESFDEGDAMKAFAVILSYSLGIPVVNRLR